MINFILNRGERRFSWLQSIFVVRPERLELPAYWFEASRSIQLSYGRTPSAGTNEFNTRSGILIA
jgi:hypothetical protein